MATVNTLVPTVRVSVTDDRPTKLCGRTVTGLRTLVTPSLKTTSPNTQAPRVADVRATWTVTVCVAPGAIVKLAGVTTVLKPGTLLVEP